MAYFSETKYACLVVYRIKEQVPRQQHGSKASLSFQEIMTDRPIKVTLPIIKKKELAKEIVVYHQYKEQQFFISEMYQQFNVSIIGPIVLTFYQCTVNVQLSNVHCMHGTKILSLRVKINTYFVRTKIFVIMLDRYFIRIGPIKSYQLFKSPADASRTILQVRKTFREPLAAFGRIPFISFFEWN